MKLDLGKTIEVFATLLPALRDGLNHVSIQVSLPNPMPKPAGIVFRSGVLYKDNP